MSGAPLIHPVSRELWGVIDLAVYRQSLSPEVVLATKAAASGIWGLVVEHETELHRFLLERLANTAKFSTSSALAIDRNGTVVCVSEPARRLLGSGGTVAYGAARGRAACPVACGRGSKGPDAES